MILELVRPSPTKLFLVCRSSGDRFNCVNVSANMLGLNDTATPLGLKAMQELEEINPHKDTATDAMCMFLAINTSSVQLILPATVVGLMGTAANQIFLSTIHFPVYPPLPELRRLN